jgi:hypothetical protein
LTSKSYYLWRTFRKLTNEAESTEKANVKEFWRNIKMATDVTGEAWNDVTQCCLNSVWKNIWTAVVDDFEGLAAEKIFSDTRHGMAKSAGSGEINMENMAELFNSHY